ncbi:MAG: dienelactone hydrolase family protein [Woeseiaceae bacterium]
MRVKLRIACCLALISGLSSCASVTKLPDNYAVPGPLPQQTLADFCYKPAPLVEKLSLIKEKKAYRVYEAEIHAGLDGFDSDSPATFEYYEQKTGEPSAVVLLMPILNGQKHLMRPFAKKFARNGYAVIIIDTVQRKTLLDDLKDPDPALRQVTEKHRRVVDWAESRPELDVSRLAVFGASLGGFNALYLAAVDERIHVAAIALAGGSLSQVLANSEERRIVEAVDALQLDLGLDDAALLEYLDTKIETDTLMVAQHVNADRIQMILAKYDKAVPYINQQELHVAMGQPEAITLPTGHSTAALYLFYLRSAVLKFFDRKLAADNTLRTAVTGSTDC